MREYLLLLPLIFIFHDMEEILGFGWFFRKNAWLYDRFPRIMKNYIGFTEFGMAVGVYEELLLFGAVSLFAYYFLYLTCSAFLCSYRAYLIYP